MLSIIKGPYLQNPAEHCITVMWETSLPASSRVDVLLAERIHSGYQGNYKFRISHSARSLSGLNPGFTKLQ